LQDFQLEATDGKDINILAKVINESNKNENKKFKKEKLHTLYSNY
jgi:hypothetical protein